MSLLTAKGAIGPDYAAVAGPVGVIVVTTVGAILALRMRLVAYPLPISWGLVAVFVAESANHPWAAWVALVGACALAVIAGFIQVDDGVRPNRVAASES